MWDAFKILWVLCGSFSAYYAAKETLDRRGKLNAQEASVVLLFFFGGIVSLGYLVATQGENMTVFQKKKEGGLAPPSPSSDAATVAYVNQQPQSPPERQTSVLDD